MRIITDKFDTTLIENTVNLNEELKKGCEKINSEFKLPFYPLHTFMTFLDLEKALNNENRNKMVYIIFYFSVYF